MYNKLNNYDVLLPFRTRINEGLHLREIARLLKSSPATIRLWLQEFVDKGILEKKPKGNLQVYSLNHYHPLLKDIMIIVERRAYFEKYWGLSMYIEQIKKQLHPTDLCLIFGSACEKKVNKINDIDIFLVSPKNHLKKLDNLFGISVDVNYVSDLSEIVPLFKHEVINKHILLQGYEQWINWMYENITLV